LAARCFLGVLSPSGSGYGTNPGIVRAHRTAGENWKTKDRDVRLVFLLAIRFSAAPSWCCCDGQAFLKA
jgi:hypothetical protein